MEMVKKGTWVQVHEIVLEPEERTGKLPEDTKKVPLEMWVKGFLTDDAAMGEEAEIETLKSTIRNELKNISGHINYEVDLMNKLLGEDKHGNNA